MTILTRTAPLLIVMLALACGGSKPPQDTTGPGASVLRDGARIKLVEVHSAEGLAREVQSALDQIGVVELVHGRLQSEFVNRGVFSEAGDLDVAVTVTGYRMRSWSTAFWVGSMAGGDWITVSVDVSRAGQKLKSFTTDSSSIRGGMAFASVQGRFAHLNETLARRIADGL